MARDFLAIPASGVGVERLFNSSRDVCHYHRSRLLPDTIHAIMLQMCTDRFNLKQDYARIAEDVTTEEDEWDGPHEIEEGQQDPIYISDVESETESHTESEEDLSISVPAPAPVPVPVPVSSSQNSSPAPISFNQWRRQRRDVSHKS